MLKTASNYDHESGKLYYKQGMFVDYFWNARR